MTIIDDHENIVLLLLFFVDYIANDFNMTSLPLQVVSCFYVTLDQHLTQLRQSIYPR